jgi:hypothetical protein
MLSMGMRFVTHEKNDVIHVSHKYITKWYIMQCIYHAWLLLRSCEK